MRRLGLGEFETDKPETYSRVCITLRILSAPRCLCEAMYMLKMFSYYCFYKIILKSVRESEMSQPCLHNLIWTKLWECTYTVVAQLFYNNKNRMDSSNNVANKSLTVVVIHVEWQKIYTVSNYTVLRNYSWYCNLCGLTKWEMSRWKALSQADE